MVRDFAERFEEAGLMIKAGRGQAVRTAAASNWRTWSSRYLAALPIRVTGNFPLRRIRRSLSWEQVQRFVSWFGVRNVSASAAEAAGGGEDESGIPQGRGITVRLVKRSRWLLRGSNRFRACMQ